MSPISALRPSVRIDLPMQEIADFCRRWRVTELALFGSVLREDFGPDSDVDVLLTFAPEVRPSLDDWVAMEDELSRALGRRADLVDRTSLERSVNWYRRGVILNTAEVVHAA